MQAGVISLRSAGRGGGCFAPQDGSACFHLNQHQRAENIHQEPSAVASMLTMAAVLRENIAAVCVVTMVIAGTYSRSSDVPLENFQQFIHILLV